MLRGFKALLAASKEKDIIRAYNVGVGLCMEEVRNMATVKLKHMMITTGSGLFYYTINDLRLVVVGVATFDIHRSIKVNDTPPSREQLEALVATIDDSRRATQNFHLEGPRQNENFSVTALLHQAQATAAAAANESAAGEVNIIGLVSDTHGVLDEPTILALRRATSTVIHAGDVGDQRFKKRLSAKQVLEKLAKETEKEIVSVAGNVDQGCIDLPQWQTLKITGKKIVVIHISGFPPNVSGECEKVVKSERPDIVVFGHSHIPGVQKHGNIIYINPGSAGPRRLKLPRCVSLLSIHASSEVGVEFVPVSDLKQDLIGLPSKFLDTQSEFPKEEEGKVENLDLNLGYRKRKRVTS